MRTRNQKTFINSTKFRKYGRLKKKKRGEYSERKKAEENGKIWWEKKEFRNEAKLLIERGKNMKTT